MLFTLRHFIYEFTTEIDIGTVSDT